jgi:D-glycero-D-manno-heptose 1,7-bisphosphate phosphatase
VTNQAGVAEGLVSATQVSGYIQQLNDATCDTIVDYRICMHAKDAGCACRKPNTGMVIDLATTHGLDFSSVVFVGDTENDRICANNAGVGSFVRAFDFFG